MIYKINFKNNYLEITEFGANIIKCIINSQNLFFLSKKAKFNNKTPIRGGVPLVFPNFGYSNFLPKHGFLRNKTWNYVNSWTNDKESGIKFNYKNYDHDFDYNYDLFYEIKLNDNSIITNLKIINKSEKDINFDMLYHNYFCIDINNFTCNSFNNMKYLDQLENKFYYDYNKLEVNKEIDRIYDNLNIIEFNNIKLESNANFMVLWNPYINKSRTLEDFDDNEYKNMICIEPGVKYCLKPKNEFNFWQKVIVS